MRSLKNSIAARLALGYAFLLAISIATISVAFYFGTIGVFDRSIDRKIISISDRLIDLYKSNSLQALSAEINRELADGVDSDTEIFLITSPDGNRLAGNLSVWPNGSTPIGQLIHRTVVRNGKSIPARLIVRVLPNGGRLIIGRSLDERESIWQLVWQALLMGIGLSLLIAVAGAIVFHRQLQRRIGNIRHTALEIEAGDLSRRIPVTSEDEFGLLNRDINRMLDRIEQLMDGVRHVSNAIAHDLRTPLSRIRSKLENVLHSTPTADILNAAVQQTIHDIDEIILIFDKLLQIAEAESGVKPKYFENVDLHRVALDMTELYDAIAEEKGVALKVSGQNSAMAIGDRNLLGNALASLIDNAIKYAGPGAIVEVETHSDTRGTSITVRDNGPGVPENELQKVTERFYRVDQSRNLPGNGLGLSIVEAIAILHGGTLQLQNARPGFIATIVLPNE